MDKNHDASLYSLINWMCSIPLEGISFQQWRCYAKINMSRKLKIKSGITSTRTFTLQAQSNVGEPRNIVSLYRTKLPLIFPPILEIKGSKKVSHEIDQKYRQMQPYAWITGKMKGKITLRSLHYLKLGAKGLFHYNFSRN